MNQLPHLALHTNIRETFYFTREHVIDIMSANLQILVDVINIYGYN